MLDKVGDVGEVARDRGSDDGLVGTLVVSAQNLESSSHSTSSKSWIIPTLESKLRHGPSRGSCDADETYHVAAGCRREIRLSFATEPI